MEECGAERVEMEALGDKRQVTATLAGTLLVELLPLQVIFNGKSERCHPTFVFFSVALICGTTLTTGQMTLCFIENIIIPYIKDVQSKQGTPEHALVNFDVFKGQNVDRMQTLLEENKIMLLATYFSLFT